MSDTPFLLRGRGDVSQAVKELRRLGQEWEKLDMQTKCDRSAKALERVRAALERELEHVKEVLASMEVEE